MVVIVGNKSITAENILDQFYEQNYYPVKIPVLIVNQADWKVIDNARSQDERVYLEFESIVPKSDIVKMEVVLFKTDYKILENVSSIQKYIRNMADKVDIKVRYFEDEKFSSDLINIQKVLNCLDSNYTL